MVGVPEQVMFATETQLADGLIEHTYSRGIRVGFVAGDEVYGSRELRRDIRQRGMGYVMAVRGSHALTHQLGPHRDRRRCCRMIPAHA